jgi:hypothetical protein
VEELESRVTDYEVHRQRSEKKGTVVERVKQLQKKLGDMLRAKSIETITNSIIQYSTNLDERDDYLKQLHIYEVYTKTQGTPRPTQASPTNSTASNSTSLASATSRRKLTPQSPQPPSSSNTMKSSKKQPPSAAGSSSCSPT